MLENLAFVKLMTLFSVVGYILFQWFDHLMTCHGFCAYIVVLS